jgi:predicted HicB family RNase H-like nuclease
VNNILTYKGFIGSVNYSADDHVFFGKIEGINDLVTFEGTTNMVFNRKICVLSLFFTCNECF